MAVERANPLPVGWYWVAVPPDGHPTEPMTVGPFGEWLTSDGVRLAQSSAISGTDWTWYLFEVTKPVNWQGPGYPEKAPAGTGTKPDVVADEPEPAVDASKRAFGKWINIGLFIFGGLITARIIEAASDFAKTVKGKTV